MSSFNTLNVLPAGKYFVGDPCYVISDSKWGALLDQTGFLGLYATPESMRQNMDRYDGNKCGMWLFEGVAIGASSTKHGDGGYFDQYGNCYSVDSGTLGVVPFEYIQATEKLNLSLLDGILRVVDFPTSFTVEYSDGIVFIGDIEINTDPKCDDYDDEDEDW